jgi:pimeloyl-ACP methyl ester carboxylesterase
MTWYCWLITVAVLLLLIALLAARPIVRRQSQQVFLDPGQFGLEYRDISFVSADGVTLAGWWIPAAGSARTILCLHGYAGSCDPDLKYAPDLHKAGFNLLYFDFRAHGRSGGKITSIGALEVEDCRAAIQFAEVQGSTAIGLLGFSMGGRVALLTAAADPTHINALISDGGPARLTTAIAGDIAKKHIPRFLSIPIASIIVLGMSLWTGKFLFAREPYHQAKHLPPLPVLFIHGGKDPHTSASELQHMMDSAGENASDWVIAQAGHRNAEELVGAEYLVRVIAFFERFLH